MSNKGLYVDNTPFIPFAGKTTGLEGIKADHSIRQDIYFKPSTITPDEIKKYRNSTRERVGVKQLHPGIFDDPKFYEDLVHGVKTAYSDHVPDCIKNKDLAGSKYFLNTLKENLYDSNKREPLGKSIVRNYNFPEECKKDSFKFGIPTKGIINAKELIYDGGLLDEPDDIKKLYNKTHGYTDPGQQKDRHYNWYFDKDKHAFGKYFPLERDGAKKSLMCDFLNNPYPQTDLADSRLENFRQATKDMLGKSKFFGSMPNKFGDDHAFGLKSNLGDQWNAGRCINGDGTTVTDKSVQPDIDLGRDSHYAQKLKNLQPIERDPNKVYGVPSIRSDLPKKKWLSVTNAINYGDEKDVYELLYPHPCSTRGIDDEDFDVLMTKDQIYQAMKDYDINIPTHEFDVMYEIGSRNFPHEDNKMTPNNFISTMKNLKREFMKYRTLIN